MMSSLTSILTERWHGSHLQSKYLAWASLALYSFSYTILFWPLRSGIGQFWDWSFPYFQGQIPNFFLYRSSSWINENYGAILGYSTDAIFRLILSLISFIKPEAVLFGLLILTFGFGSWGMFLLARDKFSWLGAMVLGYAAMINPAMFYKLMAGHLNYMVAYVLLIYLVNYLLKHYTKSLTSGLVVGLLISLMGIQIQFFLFGFLFFILYLAFHRNTISLPSIALSCILPLLLHAYWLITYLVSPTDITNAARKAQAVAFSSSSQINFLNLFDFSFSHATLISRFYASWELTASLLFLSGLIFLLIKSRSGKTSSQYFTVLLLILLFLGTGIYQTLTIPLISQFYPMFRESGHFAPLIILSLLLVFFANAGQTWAHKLVLIMTLLLVVSGATKIYQYAPRLDFAAIRRSFEPFLLANKLVDSNQRVMFYPFFAPYSFIQSPSRPDSTGFPLNNSGGDSFIKFSGLKSVNSSVPPEQFDQSVQYRLLASKNVAVLRPLGIQYLYDFSSIYRSEYAHYVPASAYFNDPSLVRTQPDFIQELMQNNPGQLQPIAPHAYKVADASPPIFTLNSLYTAPDPNNLTDQSFIASIEGRSFYFAPHGTSVPTDGVIYPLFQNIAPQNINPQGHLLDTVTIPGPMAKLNSRPTSIVLKGLSSSHNLSESAAQHVSLRSNQSSSSGDSYQTTVQYTNPNASLDNLIPNPSFEEGTWEPQVRDCNRYDNQPQIDMQLGTNNASDGHQYLQLEAKRHVACTKIDAPVTANTNYLLSFDYQSPNHSPAGYFLGFNDKDSTSISGQLTTKDTQWHELTKQFAAPPDATQVSIYIYAYESDGSKNNITRYDHFGLVALPDIYDKYYLITHTQQTLSQPQQVFINTDSSTHKTIRIRGAATPFYLAMDDSYHPQWQAELTDQHIQGPLNSWWPFARPQKVDPADHFQLNTLLNGWYIDPAALCKNSPACTRHPDGSYDLNMTLEFWPQRWFYIGMFVSITTLAACLGYLVFTGLKQRRQTNWPAYNKIWNWPIKMDDQDDWPPALASPSKVSPTSPSPPARMTDYFITVTDLWHVIKRVLMDVSLTTILGELILVSATALMFFVLHFSLQSIFFGLFVIVLFYWRLDARISIKFGLACLGLIIALLIVSQYLELPAGQRWANTVAVWVYYFLVIGVVKQLIEMSLRQH